MFETETDQGNKERGRATLLMKLIRDVTTKLVNIEFGRVNDCVSNLLDRREAFSLFSKGFRNGPVTSEWVRAAGLAVTTNQRGVRGFKVNQIDR